MRSDLFLGLLAASTFPFLFFGAILSVQSNGLDVNDEQQKGRRAEAKPSEAVEMPFACDAGALSVTERLRSRALLDRIGKAKQEIRELPEGYEIRLRADSSLIKDVAEWITYERLCCPFLDFQLKVERGNGSLWLGLTGQEGVKEFLQSELGLR